MCIDLDPSKLSAISLTMEHSTTRTTEENYARIVEEKALEDLKELWMTEAPPKINTPLIEYSYDYNGYA
jgi:hypothetical protein